VGLSALHHGAPTVACGNALYDMPGLTFQGGLDDFWTLAPQAKPDRVLYESYRRHLISKTQLNGSFYKPLKVPGAVAGLLWSNPPAGKSKPDAAGQPEKKLSRKAKCL
jgi:capsular polysaccharide export protein